MLYPPPLLQPYVFSSTYLLKLGPEKPDKELMVEKIANLIQSKIQGYRYPEQRKRNQSQKERSKKPSYHPTSEEVEKALELLNAHSFYSDRNIHFERINNTTIHVCDSLGKIIQSLGPQDVFELAQKVGDDQPVKGGILNIKG